MKMSLISKAIINLEFRFTGQPVSPALPDSPDPDTPYPPESPTTELPNSPVSSECFIYVRFDLINVNFHFALASLETTHV